MELEPRLTTARSCLPSPLKSPRATDCGAAPVAKSARPNMYLWAKATEPQTLSAPNRPSATVKAILPVTRPQLVLVLIIVSAARSRISYRPAWQTHAHRHCGTCGSARPDSLLASPRLPD